MSKRIVWFDLFRNSEAPEPDRAALRDHLAQAGITLSFADRLTPDWASADLIVLGQAMRLAAFSPEQKVLGLRTLNRKTRLDRLAAEGFAVQPYGAPCDQAEMDALLSDWDEGQAVIKHDWSSRRSGVFLGRDLPVAFDATSDVVMRPHVGASATIKVDVFGDHLLGATRLDTRPVGSLNWQVAGPRGVETYDVPDDIRDMIEKAGAALSPFGVGYASFDLMIGADGPRIIEVNSCSVGTSHWINHPEPYASRLAAAVARLVEERLDDLPNVGGLSDAAIKAGNEEEGVAPDHSLADFSMAPETGALLVQMMASADVLSEAERQDMAQTQKDGLFAHARAAVPAYRDLAACPDAPLLSDRYAALASDYAARHWPPDHQHVAYASSLPSSGAPAIAQTGFADTICDAALRRALAWTGADATCSIMTLIDRASARQKGIGVDTAPEHVAATLAGCAPCALWTTADKAMELAREARECLAGLSALVVTERPLDFDERAQIHAVMPRTVEVLYHAAVGVTAIRCPQQGLYHWLSDVAELHPATASTGRIVSTGLWNYATPLFNLDTGIAARPVSEVAPCECPITPGPMLRLSGEER